MQKEMDHGHRDGGWKGMEGIEEMGCGIHGGKGVAPTLFCRPLYFGRPYNFCCAFHSCGMI